MDYSAHELIYDLSQDPADARDAIATLLQNASNNLRLALMLLVKLKGEGCPCNHINTPDLPVDEVTVFARLIETFYYQEDTTSR